MVAGKSPDRERLTGTRLARESPEKRKVTRCAHIHAEGR